MDAVPSQVPVANDHKTLRNVARWLLLPAGVALGLMAEWVAFDVTDPQLWVPDVLVGWTFILCGLVAATRRPDSRAGTLMLATGFTWFVGNFADVDVGLIAWVATNAIYLHRGPLIHLILSYPRGRLSSRLGRTAVSAGYVASLVNPVWDSEVTTLLLSALLVGVTVNERGRAVGRERRARLSAVWAAAGLSLVLSGGAAARLALPAGEVSTPSLLAYEAMLCAIAVGLSVTLVRTGWDRAEITDLVVELGAAQHGTLRAELARALGDPSLQVGYWIAETDAFVDSEGRALSLPDQNPNRAVTLVQRDNEPVAVLVHDPAVLEDPALLEAVRSATRLAASNARLQAEVKVRLTELEASRRRVLQARDEEHQRLERALRDGADSRLEKVRESLRRSRLATSKAQTRELIAGAEVQIGRTLEELDRLAQGLHPRILSERGLKPGLVSLADRFPVPVDIDVAADGLPPAVEAVAYFVCAESLANVAKHASASRVTISVGVDGARALVVVEDDGVGGADLTQGSGLRGLSDRVAAIGGRLQVISAPGGGTRLAAEISLGGGRFREAE